MSLNSLSRSSSVSTTALTAVTGVARSGQQLEPVFLTFGFPSRIRDNRPCHNVTMSRIRDNRPLRVKEATIQMYPCDSGEKLAHKCGPTAAKLLTRPVIASKGSPRRTFLQHSEHYSSYNMYILTKLLLNFYSRI